MKLLVFSDSHGDGSIMKKALLMHSDIENVAFLGDGISDVERLRPQFENRVFYIVKGNNDFTSTEPFSRTIVLEGNKIFLTHGHLFGVKSGRNKLRSEGEKMGNRLMLYGHTHVGKLEDIGGILLFNPGSCSPHFTYSPSYGIVTIEKSEIFCEIKFLGDNYDSK